MRYVPAIWPGTRTCFLGVYRTFGNDTSLNLTTRKDCVIVGGGVSGLAAAVCLARAGKSVALIERHKKIGGSTHSFKRWGTSQGAWSFDTGVHCIGNIRSLHGKIAVLTGSGVVPNVIANGEIHDSVRIGTETYNIPSGERQYEEFLRATFPFEQRAISLWLDMIKTASKSLGGYGIYNYIIQLLPPLVRRVAGPVVKMFFLKKMAPLQKSLDVFLDEIEPTPRLRAVLTYQRGLIGYNPRPTSLGVFASAVAAYMHGSWYPSGGGDQIAEEMKTQLLMNGGDIYVNAEAYEITRGSGGIEGVHIRATAGYNTPGSSVMVIQTKNLLVTGNPRRLFETLLLNVPHLARDTYAAQTVEASTSHCYGFFGLDATAAALDLPKATLWCFESNDSALTGKEAYFITCPTAKDAAQKDSLATIQMLCEVPGRDWAKFFELKDQEYFQRKERMLAQMEEVLYKQLPEVRGHVIFKNLGSPVTARKYLGTYEGESYGSAHSCSRYASGTEWIKTTCDIKGLYFAGQDIYCAGVSSAIDSGITAASAILGRNIMSTIKSYSPEYI